MADQPSRRPRRGMTAGCGVRRSPVAGITSSSVAASEPNKNSNGATPSPSGASRRLASANSAAKAAPPQRAQRRRRVRPRASDSPTEASDSLGTRRLPAGVSTPANSNHRQNRPKKSAP